MANKITFTGVPVDDSAAVVSRDEIARLFSELSDRVTVVSDKPEITRTPELLRELTVRLEQLQNRYLVCLELNDKCLASVFPNMPWYDPEREAFMQEVGGKTVELYKLNRAAPDTPITVLAAFQGSVFVPGANSPTGAPPKASAEAEKELSAEVEAFYYAASKFWDLLEQQILRKRNSKFIGVKMVRNRLLEHAIKGAVNSFGATDVNGPVVKPMRSAGEDVAPHDPGLIPNVSELLTKSAARLKNLAKR